MCTPMHLILPPTQNPSNPMQYSGALYIGSLTAVMDKDMLREHHITHLVHVVDVPWLPMSEKEGFVGYKLPIEDVDSTDIRPHLEAVCNHIDAALKSGRNVLVHCHQVSSPLQLVFWATMAARGGSSANGVAAACGGLERVCSVDTSSRPVPPQTLATPPAPN